VHLGKYEVVKLLATGGMAEIYLARSVGAAGFEKQVVLKKIHSRLAEDKKFVALFLEEARLAATLVHANITGVFDVGESDGSYFFAMEHVDGQDVRTILQEMQALGVAIPLDVAIAIVQATAHALAYAHDRRGPEGPLGIVHRDVSPSNILVSYDGAVKLVDFGIARVRSKNRQTTESGTLRGKIPYMSPEQSRAGKLDRRSDLFSLGSILYELTTGQRPFEGPSDFAILEQIVNHDANRPSSVVPDYPPALEAIVGRMLARDREERFQSADEVLEALEAASRELGLRPTSSAVARFMQTLFAAELAEAGVTPTAFPEPIVTVETAPLRKPEQRTREYPDGMPAVDMTRTATRRYPPDIAAIVNDFSGDTQTRPHASRFADERTQADSGLRFDPVDAYRVEVADALESVVPDENAANQYVRRFEMLVGRATASLALGQVDEAVFTASIALDEISSQPVAPLLFERERETLGACFDAYLGDRRRALAIVRPLEDFAALPLGHEVAFLVSRIDGSLSIDDIIDVSGMPAVVARQHLCQLLMLGIVA